MTNIKQQNILPVRSKDLDLAKLLTIDWEFKNAQTDYLTHSLHPYPAKFIPQIPKNLIQELSLPGDVVADIFCGSGTTLVEALLLKRHAVGVDANPIACIISEAKTSRLNDEHFQELTELVKQVNNLIPMASLGKDNLFGPFQSNAPRPDSPDINFWFESFVIEELAELRSMIMKLSPPARTLALAVFSSIIVSVSRQDSDTRYVRRKKKIFPGDTMRLFLKSLLNAIEKSRQFREATSKEYFCRVICADILSRPYIGSVDLVVCSPPYPNAWSYHLYHRTRLLWLGFNPEIFKKAEIGSHRKYSRRGINGATAETFSKELHHIFEWLNKVLKPGGYACFVIGNSVIKGNLIRNDELLIEAAESLGFSLVVNLERKICLSKKAFIPTIGKIRSEKIIILQSKLGW